MKARRLGKASSLVLALGSLLNSGEKIVSASPGYLTSSTSYKILADQDYSFEKGIYTTFGGLAMITFPLWGGYILEKIRKKR